MNKFFFSIPSTPGMGLTNQIYSLITAIISAFYIHKKCIFIGDFLCDYSKLMYINPSAILDMEKLHAFLQKRFGMTIYDLSEVNFTINNIKYGTYENHINITESMFSNNLVHTQHNHIFIPTSLDIHTVCGYDPNPCEQKHLFLDYNLNDDNYIDDFMEDNGHLREDVLYNITRYQHIHNHMGFPLSQDYSMFMEILENIEYNTNFVNIANDFTKDFKGKINVVHIRAEIDGIIHWSKMNNLDEYCYHDKLIQKYIQLIENNINKDDDTIILSHELNENIRIFLDTNNYRYHFIDKNQNGRELNAIVDLLIGSQCNNVCIYASGSTFSAYLVSRLPENVKKICIDLNHLESSS